LGEDGAEHRGDHVLVGLRYQGEEDCDRDLNAWTVVFKSIADVGDHHVHVRASEATEELGEG
jgi:hypothetical protein